MLLTFNVTAPCLAGKKIAACSAASQEPNQRSGLREKGVYGDGSAIALAQS